MQDLKPHRILMDACVRAQSCFFATPWTVCPPGSSVHGILQAKILEWVAMPSSRGSSQPRDRTHISCTSWQIYYH